jgi:hypothetical protein
MRPNVYRRRFEIVYTICSFNKNGQNIRAYAQQVLCHITVSYTLYSTTGALTPHTVSSFVERHLDREFDSCCKFLHVRIGGTILSEDEIKSHTKLTENNMEFNYPIEVPAQGGYEVIIESQHVKQRTDMEVWGVSLPSDGLRLTVRTPTGDLDVRAQAHHSEQLRLWRGDKYSKTWVLKYAIFPHQSVVFWWHSAVSSAQGCSTLSRLEDALVQKNTESLPTLIPAP